MSRLAGLRVVLLGDSHSIGPAGAQFVADLREHGAIVTVDGRVGRAAVDLVGREADHVAGALAERPDLLVLWLGTNDGPTVATARAFAALRDQAAAAGVREVWSVGPPAFSPDATAADGSSLADRADHNAATLAEIFGRSFIDSRRLTRQSLEPPDRTPDLIHFQRLAGAAWGTAVAAQIIATNPRRSWGARALGAAAIAAGGYALWRWWNR